MPVAICLWPTTFKIPNVLVDSHMDDNRNQKDNASSTSACAAKPLAQANADKDYKLRSTNARHWNTAEK